MPLNLKNRWWPATARQNAMPVVQTAETPVTSVNAQAVLDLREALETAEADCAEPRRIHAFLPLSQWMARVQDQLTEPGSRPQRADAAHTPPSSNRSQ